ncbi:MAG: ABC transporter permease [Deltaproteobacteria bacterium]|nr:ABC transporter permease [Deltaproteobacteria bacterium]
MRFYLTVAWRNLFRQGRRTLITALALSVGVALCMAMWAFADGMMGQMFDLLVTQQLGHVQVHHPEYPTSHSLYDTIPGAGGRLERLDARPEAGASTGRLVAFGLVGTQATSLGARMVGVEPTREDAVTGISGRIEAGRFLSAGERREGGSIPVVVGRELAKKLDLGVGGELVMITQASDGSLANELLEIVGTARTGNAVMDRAGVYAPLADLQQVLMLEDQVHEIIVLGQDPEESAALSAVVGEAIADPAAGPSDVDDLLIRSWSETDPITAQMMGMTDGMMIVLLLVVFAAAGLGVLNTMLMAVFERTRELGLLKALGLKPRQVVLLILTESGLLGLLAAAGGLVIGLAVDAYLVAYGVDLSVGEGQGFEYEGVRFDPVIKGIFEWNSVWVTLAMVICVCLVASLWPSLRAARLRPVDAMRKV